VRIKLDENVHGDARDALAGWGHDVTTAREEGLTGHADVNLVAAVKAKGCRTAARSRRRHVGAEIELFKVNRPTSNGRRESPAHKPTSETEGGNPGAPHET